jgi:hypothetical protein
MEIEGRGAWLASAGRDGAAPYAAVAELTAAAEPEPQPIEPEPGAQSRLIKSLSCYERRETTVVEGLRYG